MMPSSRPHIATIMDYDGGIGLLMSKAWLYLARRFNPSAKITVFTGSKGAEFAHDWDVDMVRLDSSGLPQKKDVQGFGAIFQEYFLARWRWLDQHPNFGPHLFIEPDAWILADLSDWWAVAQDKPLVLVEERPVKGGPLFNTGAYSYAGGDFITCGKLLDQHRRDGGIRYPVGEQGLINAYLRHIGYDPAHPKIGFEYNCWTVGMKTVRCDDEGIEIVSGDRPADNPPYVKVLPWKWFGLNRRAKIVHSFFVKFWELPECDTLWRYCVGRATA